jgi:hypothetical protein
MKFRGAVEGKKPPHSRHPDEAARKASGEGWKQIRCVLPSFETRAFGALLRMTSSFVEAAAQ